MAFREVRVFQVREVLRLWMRGEGVRSTERLVGVDRKTVRRYVAAAVELGLVRDGGEGQLSDEFVGSVVEAVRPHRVDGRGEAWRLLVANHKLVEDWLKKDELTVVKVHDLLCRRGILVPQRTLHRYALEVCHVGRAGHDGARRRRGAGRRTADRLRQARLGAGPAHRPLPGVPRADLHTGGVTLQLRVVELPPDDR